jgi:hypothetical protein
MSTYGHSLVEVLTLKEASHLRHYCHPSRSRCGSRICEGRVVRLIDQRASLRLEDLGFAKTRQADHSRGVSALCGTGRPEGSSP